MFSWFSFLPPTWSSSHRDGNDADSGRKNFDSADDVYEFVAECNMLVIADKKENKTVSRLIESIMNLHSTTHHFRSGFTNANVDDDGDDDGRHNDDGGAAAPYSAEKLDAIVLSQKASLEKYEVPPSLIVLDRCTTSRDSSYRSLIAKNKKHRFTTLTVVSDIDEIDDRLAKSMDAIILCKLKDRVRMTSICRSLWQRKFAKNIGFDRFYESVKNAVGFMKVGVITRDGLRSMKLKKNDTCLVRVLDLSQQKPA